jgi:hypothetical protein
MGRPRRQSSVALLSDVLVRVVVLGQERLLGCDAGVWLCDMVLQRARAIGTRWLQVLGLEC